MKKYGSRTAALCASTVLACFLALAIVPMVFPAGDPERNAGDKIAERIAADGGARQDAQSDSGEYPRKDDGEAASEVPTDSLGRPAYEAGVVLVRLEEGIAADQAKETLAKESDLAGLTVNAEGDGYVEFGLPQGVSVDEARARMKGSSVVASSQPNFYYYVAATDDAESSASDAIEAAVSSGPLAAAQIEAPLYVQAATNDPYVEEGKLWNLESIRAYEAWDRVKTDGTVTVAVMDEGFNADHEDLTGNIAQTNGVPEVKSNYNETRKTWSSAVTEFDGHGTHVAGIVSARANNGLGIAGVSYNAKLMLIQIATEDKSSSVGYQFVDSKTLDAAYDLVMSKAKAHNIKVVNLSVGAANSDPVGEGEDWLLSDSINAAYDAGIITVAAACNSGTGGYKPPFYAFPSDYKKVVSVISLTKNSDGSVVRMTSSNYNVEGQEAKNISAPGKGIYSTYYPETDAYSSTKSGTSMATPHVAGVLALMFTANPELTADEAVSKLYSSARDLQYTNGTEIAGEGWDRYTGYGEVDALAAVKSSTRYISGEATIDVGGTTQLSCKGVSEAQQWSTSDDTIAAISYDAESSKATVTGKSAGQVSITVKDEDGEATQVVSVVAPTMTGPDSITFGETATYRATSVADGDWSWSSSDAAIASIDATGTVTANGVGNATLKAELATNPNVFVELPLSVTPASIDGATVTLSETSYTYDGEPKQPDVESIVLDGTRLHSSDYDITFPADMTNASTKTIVITGKGDYMGAIDVSYAVTPASQSFKASPLKKTVKYKKLKKKTRKVTCPVTVSGSQGEVSYAIKSVSKKAAKKKLSIDAKSGKITVRKGLKKGKYAVTIAVTAAGTQNYLPATQTVKAVIQVK